MGSFGTQLHVHCSVKLTLKLQALLEYFSLNKKCLTSLHNTIQGQRTESGEASKDRVLTRYLIFYLFSI